VSDGASGEAGEDAYRSAGVDYEVLDAGKRLAIDAALATSGLLTRRGGRALDDSRGEPAFVFEWGGQTLALVLEGLGTKSVIARMVAEAQGVNRFRDVAIDTVAAIVNDLCCVGAAPLVVNAYFATGTPAWFAHGEWHAELIEGWRAACEQAVCTWGGGESPSLPELVAPEDVELAGSAVGAMRTGVEPIMGRKLAPGDEIVLVASNGLHANGSSLARMVAKGLPQGFATPLKGEVAAAKGQTSGETPLTSGDTALTSGDAALASGDAATFGEALLEPSFIYSGLVEAVLDAGVPVTYLSHITGHGFLKLMRPARDLTYRIGELLPVPEVLRFLAERAGMSERSAYSTLNMGCGFAVYCAAGSGATVVEIARGMGLEAIVAGGVEDGPRRVVIEPLAIEFDGEELRLGPER
jgi:phosphoribosylformylglycinamidine cyclo-ligase